MVVAMTPYAVEKRRRECLDKEFGSGKERSIYRFKLAQLEIVSWCSAQGYLRAREGSSDIYQITPEGKAWLLSPGMKRSSRLRNGPEAKKTPLERYGLRKGKGAVLEGKSYAAHRAIPEAKSTIDDYIGRLIEFIAVEEAARAAIPSDDIGRKPVKHHEEWLARLRKELEQLQGARNILNRLATKEASW